MTTKDTFGRNLSAWLHEEAAHRVPDHLGEILVQTAATRQRRWWSSLERWLPMDSTLRPRLVTLPGQGRFLLVAGLLIVLATLAIVAVGSQRWRLPEPFGLARNGAVVTSSDGDIFLIDPATADSRLFIGGNGFDFGPVFSRDGTRMVFLRSDGALKDPATLTMYVAKPDGSDVRALTPPTPRLDWYDWSPDGTRIAYVSAGDLWVVDIDGGEPRRIDDTGPVHFPTWLPPDGKEIIYRRETTSPGIFAISPDGSGRPHQLSKTPPLNKFDYQGIGASPDGTRVLFTRWSSEGIPRVFALDVANGTDIAFPMELGIGQQGGVYSPDGTRVAYARIYDGAYEVVIANADGTGNERAIGPKKAGPADGFWTFTPDGTALVVRYGTDEDGATQLLPLDGSLGTSLGAGSYEFVDVQRLAP